MDHDDSNEFAVGLARHNAVVRDLYGSTHTTGTLLSGNSASGTSKVPSLTMPCVTKEWKVRDCFTENTRYILG